MIEPVFRKLEEILRELQARARDAEWADDAQALSLLNELIERLQLRIALSETYDMPF